MTDEDYLTAVLNCDDQSGMATDAAWRAVSALRARAERAEAAIERVRGMAEAALAAHDELEGTYATVSAKAILNALNGW